MKTNDLKQGNVRQKFSPVTSKIILILVLTLLLQIPALRILSLSSERQARKNAVSEEIIGKVGGRQMITGPLISIPYTVKTKVEIMTSDIQAGKSEKRQEEVVKTHYIWVMPEQLNVAGTLKTEYRHRGIYKVPVYQASLGLSGWFTLPDLSGLATAGDRASVTDIQWDKAVLSVAVCGMEGLRSPIAGTFDQKGVSLRPGISGFPEKGGAAGEVISVEPGSTRRLPFSLSFALEGGMGLHFAPVGRITQMNLSSDWASPSFAGKFLPVARFVSERGFSAKWKVLDLNTNFPCSWVDDALFPAISGNAFGVDLAEPVNDSLLFERSVKYCLLFVVLTFFALFISELMAKVRLHFMQYLLPGLAIVVFFLLLLSLSEHLGFSPAYWAAASSVVLLVTFYVAGIVRRTALGLLTGGILALLYGYWFVILQMEDYALLCGGVGTFVLLSAVMIGTRKLDWSSLDKRLGNISPRGYAEQDSAEEGFLGGQAAQDKVTT